jgi:DNA-binding XRE family transcriptional regulator
VRKHGLNHEIRTVNEIGATIDERKQRGWTQGDLAVRVGISKRTWLALEGGNPRGEIGVVVRVESDQQPKA